MRGNLTQVIGVSELGLRGVFRALGGSAVGGDLGVRSPLATSPTPTRAPHSRGSERQAEAVPAEGLAPRAALPDPAQAAHGAAWPGLHRDPRLPGEPAAHRHPLQGPEYSVLVENSWARTAAAPSPPSMVRAPSPAPAGLEVVGARAESYLGWKRKMAVLWEVARLFSYS